MKILITGASGFLGAHLTETLEKDGHLINCLVRSISNVNRLKTRGVKLMHGDVTDIDSLYKAVEGMDYVYHLAIARHPKTIKDYYRVNYLGTENLLKACLKINPSLKKFVYVSSLAAAGYSPGGKPLIETDPPHPLTHYGKSKLMGETVVLKHKCELPVVILRPAVIYGQGNMFFDYLFGMLKAGFNPLWRGYSSLCYIDDVVCALKLCAESKKAESNIYFISDGGVYSWRQITDAICARIKPKKIDVPIPACVIRLAAQLIPPVARIIRKPYLGSKFIEFSYPYWLCDPEKIRNELEFKCGFDLKRGMDLWLDEYCRRGIPGNA